MSANIHDHISHKFCALEKTSSCFQYIASTIFLAHIIISIDTAHRQIIQRAFLWLVQSDFVIKLILFHTKITKMTISAKYNAIFIKGYAILLYKD
ncbi:hypothetical protein J5751_05225 [bacterium]|nr:hypothetical protein [bacterium]